MKHAHIGTYGSFNKFKWLQIRIVFVLLIFTQILLMTQSLLSQDNIISTNDGYTLENENIKVLLGKDKPVIYKYVYKVNNGVLLGNPQNFAPEVLIYEDAKSILKSKTNISYKPVSSKKNVTYHASITYDDKPAVEFDLGYTLTDNDLNIEFNNVVEHRDFYLIHIQLPGLITVKADESVAKLTIPADAGRLIDVNNTGTKDFEYEIDWRNPILAGFAYNSKTIGILDTKSIENHTIASVYESDGIKYGSFSMKMMHRLKEYDLEEFGPKVPAIDPKYLLKVQDSCKITVSIVGDYDKNGEVSWVDGTKLLRDKVDATPNPYYLNKSFIRTFVDRPPTKRDSTGTTEELRFEEVLKRIKEFAVQTDSAACIMYLLGWQYEGHDSGYPSVDKVNENLGGFDGLVKLIQEAKKYNVNVTFYDNYDDSYPNHPGWDPDMICRDAQDNLMKGGVWEGNQSYLISSYKYVMKSGLDRVRFTLNKYPIERAYFIDVLAGGYNNGRKYDFNPESPAGAVKNFEGKLMIINEFNKHGVDVATEDFTGFFVGHVGTFGDIIAFNDTYFKGEEQIPMIPFIYHSKTSFGMKISNRSLYTKTFLYGQRAQKLTNKRNPYAPAEYILDALPKQKLYGKAMKSYRKNGDQEQVVYEDGSTVEIDVKADKYTVALGNGAVIAKNYTSFVPIKKNVFMACSRDGGLFSYPLPEGWSSEKRIQAFKINGDGSQINIQFRLIDKNLEFNTEANIPYKVIYY